MQEKVKNQELVRMIEEIKFRSKVNQKEIAEAIGITQQYLSDLINGRFLLKSELKDKLYEKYTYLKDSSSAPRPSEPGGVPLIPVSAQGGSLNDFVTSVREGGCERIAAPMRDAELAVTVSGDSMSPEYPGGSTILIKRVNERAFVEWGKAYVLDTCNGVVVKLLAPSDREDCVRCVSVNRDPQYAPFDVCWRDVFGVYRVLMVLVSK